MTDGCAALPPRIMWHFSKFLELGIDRPASDVWPYLFRKHVDVWTQGQYETVAGSSGSLGEIYAAAYPIASQGGTLSYEAIDLEPEKHLVLKIVYSHAERNERRLVGFDLFSLKEANGATTLFFQQATELPVDPDANLASLTQRHHQFLSDIFGDLKRMVEGAPLKLIPNPWNG